MFEQLEPRLMLSTVEWLPGLVGANDFMEHTNGQVVYLDFDGAEDVTYNGPVTVAGLDIPVFSAEGTALAGSEAELIADITRQVADILSPLGVYVTAEMPNVSEYSTIYIGGTDDAFSIYGNFNGLAETVDVGNIYKSDDSFVFSEELVFIASSPDMYSSAIADLASHEAGHLMGLFHAATVVEGDNALDAVAHKQTVHQYIIEQAVSLFSDTYDAWRDIDFNFIGSDDFASKIEQAAWDEDAQSAPWGGDYYGSIFAAFREHFYDPDEPDSSDHLDSIWGVDINPDNESALDRAELYWPDYVTSEYASGNADNGWYYLGRVAHLIGDMTTPAHVHLDPHGNIQNIGLLVGDDNYEDYMVEYDDDNPGEYNYKLWDASDVSGSIPTYGSLSSLFYNLAEITDDYDSDNVDGEFSGSADINWGEVDYEYCKIYGDTLMPLAYKYTASLFKMFVDDVKPTITISAPSSAETSVTITAYPDGEGVMGIDGVTFQYSTDGSSWNSFATDTSSSGGWTASHSLTSFSYGSTLYYRALALDNGSLYSDWSGLESVVRTAPTPTTPAISAKTHSSGNSISENTWQQDDDPYFYWGASSGGSIVGYSYALDTQPDNTVDTTSTYIQYSSGALSNGTHTVYVKAKNNAGVWGSAGSFDIWVDDAGDSLSSLDAEQGGRDLSSGSWVTNSAVDFSWSAPTGVVSPIAGYSYAIDATPDSSVDVAGASWQSSALGIGQHTFSVRAIDQAGNAGSVQSYTINVGAREYIVNSLADGGSTSDGQLTLREAIDAANTNPGTGDAWSHGSFIGFEAADRVVFTSGLAGGTIVLNGSQLSITDDLILEGTASQNIIIDANGQSRVLNISAASTTLDHLTITGGNLEGSGGDPYNNSYGSGIYNRGDLTLTNCTISGNSVSGGPFGGCIIVGNTLTLTNCTISGNLVSREPFGGYIITGNTLTLTNCTISGNSVDGCIISTRGTGGATITSTLTNCTISGNSVDGCIISTKDTDNASITGTLNNTIIALNSEDEIFGPWSGNYNLIGIDPKFVRNPSDGGDGWGDDPTTPGVDEGANDDYGDLRLTAVSPAVNAGSNALAIHPDGSPLTTDMDGNPRVADGTVDIGAYEYQGAPPPGRETPSLLVTTLDDSVDLYDGYISLREAIYYAGQSGLGSSISFDTPLAGGTIELSGYALWVDKSISIDGSSAAGVTLNAGGQSRVMTINGNGSNEVFLMNLMFTGGSTTGNGGGICNWDGTLTLTNSTVAGNSSIRYGGGIYNYIGILTLTNSTVSGNSSIRYGGGIRNYSGTLTLNNAIVALNEAPSDADIYGSFTNNSSMVGGDPMFIRNPWAGADGVWGTEDDDYGDLHLLQTSPAKDAGDNSLLPADAFDLDDDGNTTELLPIDLDGFARIIGGTVDLGAYELQPMVTARHIFYNNSYFDSNNPAANANDDAAIAADKAALLPGETATLANYTSYSRGINGIMIDIAGLAGMPTAGDFLFKVGNSNDPTAWSSVVAPPTSITVRSGEGEDGSDRVTVIWDDNVIQKQWLQVTVLSDANGGSLGLAEDDVFYFGNALGETGNSPTNAFVDGTDFVGVRDNPRNFLNRAPVDFAYDINRDSFVDGTDLVLARDNNTNFLTALKLITTPADGPAPMMASPQAPEPMMAESQIAEPAIIEEPAPVTAPNDEAPVVVPAAAELIKSMATPPSEATQPQQSPGAELLASVKPILILNTDPAKPAAIPADNIASTRPSKARLTTYPPLAMSPLRQESPWFSRRTSPIKINTDSLLNSRWGQNRKLFDLLHRDNDGEDDLLADLLAPPANYI